MTTESTPLEFVLDDRVDGQALTPDTVDVPTLKGFLEDIEKLIKGPEGCFEIFANVLRSWWGNRVRSF